MRGFSGTLHLQCNGRKMGGFRGIRRYFKERRETKRETVAINVGAVAHIGNLSTIVEVRHLR